MKSVIIYTYYPSHSSDYDLSYFARKELSYKPDIDYIIVINGFTCSNTIEFPNLDNLTILKRENKGFDYGGHNFALEYLAEKNRIYDFYFFMNSGVFGPVLPHYIEDGHWTSVFINKISDIVKLVGTTIVCLPPSDLGGYGPKVEGFFFMVDAVGLTLLREKKTIFCNHKDKVSAIVNGEYGMSNCILDAGYSIDCMLRKYKGIDWRDSKNYDKNDCEHPSRKNSFYGNSINPYEVIFHKWYWDNDENVNFEIIDQYVNDNT